MKNLLLNKTILVAGAGGLLGSHIVPKLIQQGAQVIAVDIDITLMSERLKKVGVDLTQSNISLKN